MQITGEVCLYRIKSDNYKPTVAIRHPVTISIFPVHISFIALGNKV